MGRVFFFGFFLTNETGFIVREKIQGLPATSGLARTANTRTRTDADDKTRAKAGEARRGAVRLLTANHNKTPYIQPRRGRLKGGEYGKFVEKFSSIYANTRMRRNEK